MLAMVAGVVSDRLGKGDVTNWEIKANKFHRDWP
jgi:hypothetical protein